MAQLLSLSAPNPTVSSSTGSGLPRTRHTLSTRHENTSQSWSSPEPRTRHTLSTRHENTSQSWSSLQKELHCNGRVSCIFSDNRKEEQARKALESALGGKRDEFEKWNKEIKRREEAGGGGDAGGGGWFGWGRRFGWSNDDHFWQEAQAAILTVLGIIVMYLIVAKGEVLLAVIINPLLYALRGPRNALTFITSRIFGKTSPDSRADFDASKKGDYSQISAKERVLRKWGSQ